MSPRTGRPTDNPKPFSLTIRIDEKSKKYLDRYCKVKKVSVSEAIRRGIKKLQDDIKE